MELYFKLIDVIAPVFFVIGIGYYLGKKNPEISTDFITTFAGNVGTPAMIFYTITTTGVTLAVFIEYFIYALIIITGFSLVGILFLLILKKDFISELPPLILPNTGNMGIPICLFAYGTAGLGGGLSYSFCYYFATLHTRRIACQEKFCFRNIN